MPVRLEPPPSFAQRLSEAGRPQIGMWVCSGSALVAEICAGSGLDWLLVDTEHSPNGLESTLEGLQAVAPYPITPVVRPASGDPVLVKQLLDLGAANLLVPMVNTAAEAAAAVAAVRYPPAGIRGVGSALARASRWSRVPDYLGRATDIGSLTVQIETAEAVENVEEILAVDGVDAIFLGPADLAASMGVLGQQEHHDVVAAVEHCLTVAAAAGVPAGVNAFAPARAEHYLGLGARFVLVGADVALLARASEGLAERFLPAAGPASAGTSS